MKQVLYLGDTALREAASYLAGVMAHAGISFDYFPSDWKVSTDVLTRGYRVVILSDFPALNFSAGQLESLAGAVQKGMGLLMIGGWESFTGPNREYTQTALAGVLPVVMQASDDRVNCPQPCLIEKDRAHPIVDGLPFETCPPGIGGFNRFVAKPEGVTVLSSRQIRVRRIAGMYSFEPAERVDPLLVVGGYGAGRMAALATDVAPHWVGGFVDWGDARVAAQAEGANAIEVGNGYAEFFNRLVRWMAGLL